MKNSNYKVDISRLDEGDEFKNFTELHLAVTGKKPPSGKRNQDAVKRELSKYFEFCLKSDLIPGEKSKRALIITKIYDSPRKIEENRGKRGKYTDLIKPLLIVSCNCVSFEGKMSSLVNTLGILQRYSKNKPDNSNIWSVKSKSSKLEYNLWATNENMTPGKQQYLRVFWHQVRSAIERSLTSLQNEGIIEWQHYYQLIPDMLIDIEGSKELREKTKIELKMDFDKRKELLEEVQFDENSILQRETIECLNIYSNGWKGKIDLQDYREELCWENQGSNKLVPIRATPKQENAIRNLEDFMRQYAYKKYFKIEKLPQFVRVENKYQFFQNVGLSQKYKQLTKEMFPWLIECRALWKELEYRVIGTPQQIEQYVDYEIFDYKQYQEQLSCVFLEYMDDHMDKIKFMSTADTLSDIKGEKLEKWNAICVGVPLSASESACTFHEKLKSYYT